MSSAITLIHPRTLPRLLPQARASANAPNVSAALGAQRHNPWGWLPALICLEAGGLMTTALADAASRANASWSDSLFWLGLVAIVLPVAIRILSQAASRAERLAIVVSLGMTLYVVKILAYPVMFTFFDELLHTRTAQDILAQGRLFSPNALLPISPLYPGLEIITTALSQLTGLSTFGAGLVVIGAARLLLILAMFVLYEGIARSARVAGIATLLYMANPHFIFFEAQFAYESLAIALGIFALALVVERMRAAPGWRAAFGPVIWITLGALTITHHLTSYAIAGLLALWALIALAQRWRANRRPAQSDATPQGAQTGKPIGVGAAALLATLMAATWLLATGDIVVGYVVPHLSQSLQEFSLILAGDAPSRRLFHDYAGQTEPVWQTLAAFLAVGLITFTLPIGAWRIWRGERANAAALALGICSLAYPASQLFRLTTTGSELADRLPDYLFIGVAFTLALVAARLPLDAVFHRWGQWLQQWLPMPTLQLPSTLQSGPWANRVVNSMSLERIVLQSALLIIFIGNVIVGAGPTWTRMPGSYLVEADMRSMNAESVLVAEWARATLGPGNRFATDRDNRLTLATYGDQSIVTDLADGIDVSTLFTTPTFDAADIALLHRAHIRYLLVDRRLTTSLPNVGVYFEQNEPQSYTRTQPLGLATLSKYNAAPLVNCIYDSGDILIYDLGAYSNAS